MSELEKQIIQTARKSMADAITKELTGYNKPLSKLTERVIENNSDELYNLINNEFINLLNGDGFKEALQQALNEKLARTLIQKMGGDLESKVNELKSNPETRAKITIAISDIVSNM